MVLTKRAQSKGMAIRLGVPQAEDNQFPHVLTPPREPPKRPRALKELFQGDIALSKDVMALSGIGTDPVGELISEIELGGRLAVYHLGGSGRRDVKGGDRLKKSSSREKHRQGLFHRRSRWNFLKTDEGQNRIKFH